MSILVLICTFHTVIVHADFIDDVFGGVEDERLIYKRKQVFHHKLSRRHHDTSHFQGRISAHKTELHHILSLKYPHTHSDERLDHEANWNKYHPQSPALFTSNTHIIKNICYPLTLNDVQIMQPDLIMHDRTLKKGDSVMTNTGVKVFLGHNNCPHKSSDFVSIKSSTMTNVKNRNILVELDKLANEQIPTIDHKQMPAKWIRENRI